MFDYMLDQIRIDERVKALIIYQIKKNIGAGPSRTLQFDGLTEVK